MTERGVGRYPYLHRQTMLFLILLNFYLSFTTFPCVFAIFSSSFPSAVLERQFPVTGSVGVLSWTLDLD